MKHFAPIICALFLFGCAAARNSVADEEKTYTAVIPHTKSKTIAYQISEIWLAETYVSEKTISDLKQPDNGLIIIKPITTWYAGGEAFGAKLDSPIMVKIVNQDNQTTLFFTLYAATNQYNMKVWPAESEVVKIKAHWSELADSLKFALTK